MINFFKKIFFFFWGIGKLSLFNKASILMYHSVGNNLAFFTVKPDNFEKQLKYLKSENFYVIKLSELINKIKKGEDVGNCVCLTFDDGYLDNIEIVLPLLKKYNFPATIFIPTNLLGKKFINSEGVSLLVLSEKNIREADSNLLEFMPHTDSHVLLNDLPENKYNGELLVSRTKIELLTGKLANILAYPKGKYSESVINYLKLNNWLAAVTVEPGLIDRATNLYGLNRNAIVLNTSFSEFKLKTSSRLEIYIRLKKWIKNLKK